MTEFTQLTDDDLLRCLRSGSEDAFAALYRRRGGAIYRFALQMTGRADVAEEIVQEVFLAVIRDAGSYDARRGKLEAWLFGVARNQVMRVFDRESRYVQAEDEPTEPAGDDYALDDLTRTERTETVRSAVLALPPRYREVVALCDLEELSYQDAARALDCAVGTVRSRLNRGRALLAEKLRSRMGCSV